MSTLLCSAWTLDVHFQQYPTEDSVSAQKRPNFRQEPKQPEFLKSHIVIEYSYEVLCENLKFGFVYNYITDSERL